MIANMRSMAAAPLIAEGEVLGALGRLLVADRRLRRGGGRAAARAGRPCGGGDRQPAPHRAAGALAGGAGASGRRAAHARRDRGQHRRHPRARRDPPLGGRGRAPAHRLRRRPPDADAAGREVLRPTVVVGGNAAWTEEWLAQLDFPVNGGHQRPGRRQRRGDRHRGLPRRSAHPARAGRPGRGGAAGAARHGRRAAALAPGGEVIGTLAVSFEAAARLQRRRARAPPGPGRPGRDRHLERPADRGAERSREQYRYLVDESVDIMWAIDADDALHYISDSVERTDRLPRPTSSSASTCRSPRRPSRCRAVARTTCAELQEHPDAVVPAPDPASRARTASLLPVEIRGTGIVDADGGVDRRPRHESRHHRDRPARGGPARAGRRARAPRRRAAHAGRDGRAADLAARPVDVLVQTLRAAVRLLKGHGGQIGMVDTDADGDPALGRRPLAGPRPPDVPFTRGGPHAGPTTASRGAPSGTGAPLDRRLPRRRLLPARRTRRRGRARLGIRAVIAAPLIAEDGAIGAIGVYAETPGAFDGDDGELLGLLADQATIVLTNARLNAEAEVDRRQAGPPASRRSARSARSPPRSPRCATRPPSWPRRCRGEAPAPRRPRRHPPGPRPGPGSWPTTARRSAPGRCPADRRGRRSASARGSPGARSRAEPSRGPATTCRTRRSRTPRAPTSGSCASATTRR